MNETTVLEPLLTADEVGRVLRRSRRGVYRLVAANHLAAVRVGRRMLFRPADIRDYVARGAGP